MMKKHHPNSNPQQKWTSRLLLAGALLFSMAIFTEPVKADDAKTEKEWTFLLFLNGHNNLDYFGGFNVNQMEEVGSNENLNLVVQWASFKNHKTQRLLIQKDNDAQNVTSPVVESLDPVDMGDYRQLVEFVRWGVEKYPAKKYMIAVWNHGNGWYRLGNAQRDISYDDLSGNKITTEQLGLAMAEAAKIMGHKVDIYGSDACLMAMAEIAGEMKDSVQFMVGSEELEPGYGWPYSTWLQKWASNEKASAKEVSVYLTDEYIKAYDGGIYGFQDVTFSAMDLTKFDGLSKAISSLNASLSNLVPADINAVKAVAHSTQSFTYDDYRDLGDFVNRLSNSKVGVQDSVLANADQAISDLVVANAGTGIYENVSGVAFWLPTSSYNLNQHQERYSKLQFNLETGWLNFLQMLNK